MRNADHETEPASLARSPGLPPYVRKRAQRGFRGYPVVTVAFYGPDAGRATKAVAALIPERGGEPARLSRWVVGKGDVRTDVVAVESLVAFIRGCDAPTVVAPEAILGCPHEEGTDYPEGEACPACPFWAGRDRWAGLIRPGGEGDGGD